MLKMESEKYQVESQLRQLRQAHEHIKTELDRSFDTSNKFRRENDTLTREVHPRQLNLIRLAGGGEERGLPFEQ